MNYYEEECMACEDKYVHTNAVGIVSDSMPDEDILIDLAEFYKVFADSTRIKILYALLRQELCVCDICEVLGATQSAISHQLRILKQMKLVKYRKDGKSVYYSLSDNHIEEILNMGMEHIQE